MLKQIPMVLAILCASITVTISPAMSEVNQPDTTAKEKQIENGKKSSKLLTYFGSQLVWVIDLGDGRWGDR